MKAIPNKKKSPWQRRIGKWRPESFQLVAALLCISIAGCSFWFGMAVQRSIQEQAPPTPKEKAASPPNNQPSNVTQFLTPIIFPVVVEFGLISFFLLFTNKYVIERISECKRTQEQLAEHERANLLRQVNNRYRLEQELEFLDVLYSAGGEKIPSYFSRAVFCEYIQHIYQKSPEHLEDEIKKFNQDLRARKEAERGLIEGFTEDKDQQSPFYHLVGTACNEALGITGTAKFWALPFYDDVTSYLKAWLICSIRHGFPIPIEPFYVRSLEEEGKALYKGKDSYVTALKYIIKVVSQYPVLPKVERYLKTPESREVVVTYLKRLVVMFEGDYPKEEDMLYLEKLVSQLERNYNVPFSI
ncbi:hypothetical protein [Alkalinema sp. FACHB-956]|uniref:hypothetical protein n=1 Tax=Alkalinema sp. FACHB-956 TaxID=2692768 RepID=UPI001689D123|nr:hypothetical protein [Alkalinema sp. FACHB-956]MBD2327667.1 hypothetical protein [Alkalinema sp. FACHB-956]